MRFSSFRIIIIALLLPLSASADVAAARDAQPDILLVMLACLMLVLLFAIGMLAHVLKQLSLAYLDKWRKEQPAPTAARTMCLLFLLLVPAFNAMAGEAPGAAIPAVSPFISGIPRTEFYFITGFLAFEVLIIAVLLWQIIQMVQRLRDIPEKAHIPRLVLKKNFLDLFNKSVAVEKEATIMTDHEYDGIRELDNDLPPWWKWGFVLTIIFSALYLGYYHWGNGPGQVDEYHAAVAKAEEEKAAYLARAANNIDENNVTLITDAAVLSEGKMIFGSSCSACHAKDGGGGVGPNLTDDYWLHGGSIQSIFKSIKYGWPDKGMKSWKDDFSPKQLAALTSYIKSLKGLQPAAPKAPQGEPFLEEVPQGPAAADSAKQKIAQQAQGQ